MNKHNIADLIRLFEEKKTGIPTGRKEQLDNVATEVVNARERINLLLFVCTHNSRRSQLAELLFFINAQEMSVDIDVTSAGTEATALNERIVTALEFWGIDLQLQEGGSNPVYSLIHKGNEQMLFSKTVDDAGLPASGFAVITVCSDAEKNCPYIPGATVRAHLGYEDPKKWDGTDKEKGAYTDKVLEIGCEMHYLADRIAVFNELKIRKQ